MVFNEVILVDGSKLYVNGAQTPIFKIKQIREDAFGVFITILPGRELQIRINGTTNFISRADANTALIAYLQIFDTGNGLPPIYNFKGSTLFEDLPTTNQVIGDTYNILNSFTINSTLYQAGTDIAWNGLVWAPLASKISKASQVLFDNTGTQLVSTNTESAIKEVNAAVGGIDTRVTNLENANLASETWVTQQINNIENVSGESYTPITYADLVSLRADENLKKGVFYRIIDYETTTTQPESQSAGHYFDVIVQALDEKTLSENAQAIHSARDTDGYFAGSRLGAWKLKYTLDNNANEYYWADTVNGKGVIYRMIDEFDNDLPYDFKNIQFKRYLIETYTINTDLENRYYALKDMKETVSPSGAVIDDEDFKLLYTFTVIDENGVVNDVSLNTNKTFVSDYDAYFKTENNIFGFYNYEYDDEILGQTLIIKVLGNNVLLYDYDYDGYWGFYGFYYNTIGNDFNSNTIGHAFYSNAIGEGFRLNTIGSYFYSNTMEDDVRANTIGDLFRSNTIGNSFTSNTIGKNFNSNTVGSGFSSNTIGNSFTSNTIGNNFNLNTIRNYFSSNTVGNDIKYITFLVDGTLSSLIRNLYIRSGLQGASFANKLDLYYSGLYHRTYPTTCEIIANGNIVSSWEATPLTRAGKLKATNTATEWTDI